MSGADGGFRPVVVVEDDPSAAELIRIVLQECGVANPIEVFTEGGSAYGRLEAVARGEAPPPVLLLADIHVPGRTGLEILALLRGTPSTARTPAVVISGSGADGDIARAYELGIDAFLVKPAGLRGLRDVLGELGLRYVLLPR